MIVSVDSNVYFVVKWVWIKTKKGKKMKRVSCLVMMMLVVLVPSTFAGNMLDFSIANNPDGVSDRQGHISYDGSGGSLRGDKLIVSNVTYQNPTGSLDVPFPAPWTPYSLGSGAEVNFTAGNLLRTEGNLLVFGAGGSFSITGGIPIPGVGSYLEEVYHGTFIGEVTVVSMAGGFRIVNASYSGHFNDTFANVFDLSTTRDYVGVLSIDFNTKSNLANGFNSLITGGDTAVDVSAVPEPTSLSVFGLGITSLAVYLRRRKR